MPETIDVERTFAEQCLVCKACSDILNRCEGCYESFKETGQRILCVDMGDHFHEECYDD